MWHKKKIFIEQGGMKNLIQDIHLINWKIELMYELVSKSNL